MGAARRGGSVPLQTFPEEPAGVVAPREGKFAGEDVEQCTGLAVGEGEGLGALSPSNLTELFLRRCRLGRSGMAARDQGEGDVMRLQGSPRFTGPLINVPIPGVPPEDLWKH